MPAEREIVNQQPEAQRGGDAGLNRVRDLAWTPGSASPAFESAISMDHHINTLKEFNETFDPKNHMLSEDELHTLLTANEAQVAATQKVIEARLSSLGFTMDKEQANKWLTSHHGQDVQITGLDDTKK